MHRVLLAHYLFFLLLPDYFWGGWSSSMEVLPSATRINPGASDSAVQVFWAPLRAQTQKISRSDLREELNPYCIGNHPIALPSHRTPRGTCSSFLLHLCILLPNFSSLGCTKSINFLPMSSFLHAYVFCSNCRCLWYSSFFDLLGV